jgi:hypothetical protein
MVAMNRLLVLAAAIATPALLTAQAPQPVDTSPTVVPAPETKLPRTHAPKPTGQAITAEDLMTRLYIFADDSMMGRAAGTAGNVLGTTYIGEEVERLGLTPAGDSGTFFQTIPLKTRTVDSLSILAVDGAPLVYGSEWAVYGGGGSTDSLLVPSSRAVYGGSAGDSMTLSDEQLRGRMVVVDMSRGGRGLRGARVLEASGATVAIVVPERYLAFAARPRAFVDDPATEQEGAGRPTLFLTAAAAAKLFDAPFDKLREGDSGKTASLDLRVHVEPFPFASRNVVAILPGADPALRNEYVAIGAHNDHIGFSTRPVDHDSLRIFNHFVRPGGAEDQGKQATREQQARVNRELAAFRASHPNATRPDSIDNGADDDGSGSVSVLEIAEHLASVSPRPKRSILFVWHVGEERGLLGSRYFTDHPTVPRDSIVAQLNMDMVGRGDAWDETGQTKGGAVLHGGPNYLQIVGSRRLSTELGDLIERVNTEGRHGLRFDYSMDADGHPMNIYCRSDHYEYARYGIPIAFFTTGGHSDYHQVTDEPQYIDYDHMARVDRLVADVALHLANLDHRPVVDHPKPDPNGRCQQ